jgi:hypothetical protein
LLALVDANYRFIAIHVGTYGKNSDGGIFSNSNLGKSLKDKLQIPPGKQLPGSEENLPYALIGDEAFPLSTYLMRPYSWYLKADHSTSSSAQVKNERSYASVPPPPHMPSWQLQKQLYRLPLTHLS